jgi:hypothetical protein
MVEILMGKFNHKEVLPCVPYMLCSLGAGAERSLAVDRLTNPYKIKQRF